MDIAEECLCDLWGDGVCVALVVVVEGGRGVERALVCVGADGRDRIGVSIVRGGVVGGAAVAGVVVAWPAVVYGGIIALWHEGAGGEWARRGTERRSGGGGREGTGKSALIYTLQANFICKPTLLYATLTLHPLDVVDEHSARRLARPPAVAARGHHEACATVDEHLRHNPAVVPRDDLELCARAALAIFTCIPQPDVVARRPAVPVSLCLCSEHSRATYTAMCRPSGNAATQVTAPELPGLRNVLSERAPAVSPNHRVSHTSTQ